jgi:uncharacterized protein YdcH (DUF465 family)
MSHVPHELADDFPEDTALIARLKSDSAHFAKLVERYHVVNRQVHRVETDIEPCSDEQATTLRRERMHLKDEIAGHLSRAKA